MTEVLTKLTKLTKIETCHNTGQLFEEYYVDSTGAKQGRYTASDQSGLKKSTCLYKGGKRHGKFIDYWKGKVYSTREYINDLMDGESITYTYDGRLMYKNTYRLGVVHGPQYAYFDDGVTISSVRTCINGEYTGIYKVYYPDSSLLEVGFLKDCEFEGEFVRYDLDGTITRHKLYVGGRIIDESQYVQDISCITPEEEITLLLVFGEFLLPRRDGKIDVN